MSPTLRSTAVSQSTSRASVGKICAPCKKSVNGKEAVLCAVCCGAFHLSCAHISKALFDEINKLNTKNKKSCFNWTCIDCADKQNIIASPSLNANESSQSMNTSPAALEVTMDEFISKLDKKIDDLLATKMNPQIEMLHEKIVALEDKLSSYVADTSTAKLTEMEAKLTALSTQLSNFEKSNGSQNNNNRDDRKKNFIIHGVPNNNDLDVKSIATAACSKYVDNFNADCMACVKLKVKEGSVTAPILCSFTSKTIRDRVFFSYIKKRDLKLGDILNDAGIDARIYLNENLTRDEAEIVRACRKLKTEGKILKHFLRDGDIYVAVTNAKNSAKRVHSLDELNAIAGNMTQT